MFSIPPSGDASVYNYPKCEAKIYGKYIKCALKEIEKSGQLILGPGVRAFEESFASWLGNDIQPDQVIGLANGTDALKLALYAFGVKAGDHIALPSHTAYATAAAVVDIGAIPVWVDIRDDRPTISAKALQECLSRSPSDRPIMAAIAVHLYGECCELRELLYVCKQAQIPLIEDCAQACGSIYQSQKVGTWGDASTFSFYPTKNLAAMGDGGALVVRLKGSELVRVRQSRQYGWNNSREAVQFGINSRLDEIQALILQQKLLDLDVHIALRRKVAEWYRQSLRTLLKDRQILEIPSDGGDWSHSFNLYNIAVKPSMRDSLVAHLNNSGIPSAVYYPKACHHHLYLNRYYMHLPNTDKLVSGIMSLPLHPYMKRHNVVDVTSALKQALLDY